VGTKASCRVPGFCPVLWPRLAHSATRTGYVLRTCLDCVLDPGIDSGWVSQGAPGQLGYFSFLFLHMHKSYPQCPLMINE
jgi:hypothetical protein